MSHKVNLIEVAEELKAQPSLLRSFQRSSLWSELEETRDAILVGAGDSYAASVCASMLAGPGITALDPYSLTESLDWAKNRPVFIISISGETRSNIELSLALRGVARKRVAITCNARSRLAATVDAVVELPFTPRAKSPGIATFTLSLAAVLKICGLESGFDFESLLSRAETESSRILVAGRRDITHFVGNNESYGASIYGTAKIYELLGGRAQASLLEEFSHMPLFSLSASDAVNVVEGADGKGELLHKKLKNAGYASSLIRPEGERIARLFFLVFSMQTAALRAARRRGLKTPHFLTDRKNLKISDEMIY